MGGQLDTERNYTKTDHIPCIGSTRKVAELLVPTAGSWNVDLIRSVFIHTDAEAILKIPVCTRDTEDFWAWYPEKRWRFTVSSAYKFLATTKLQREAWLEGRSETSTGEKRRESMD